jgi:hypothetical protein
MRFWSVQPNKFPILLLLACSHACPGCGCWNCIECHKQIAALCPGCAISQARSASGGHGTRNNLLFVSVLIPISHTDPLVRCVFFQSLWKSSVFSHCTINYFPCCIFISWPNHDHILLYCQTICSSPAAFCVLLELEVLFAFNSPP